MAVHNLSVCHVWIWTLWAGWICIEGSCAAILISWRLWWNIFSIWISPISISEQCTWGVASCIFTAFIWVCSSQTDVSSSLDILRWTDAFCQALTIKFARIVWVTVTVEFHVIWQSPSIYLTWVIPVKVSTSSKGGFEFGVDWRRAATCWTWEIWTTTLSKCAVLTRGVTIVFWPESGGWYWTSWYVIVSNLPGRDHQSLWPCCSLSLIINIHWLRSSVRNPELRLVWHLLKLWIIVQVDSVKHFLSSSSVELFSTGTSTVENIFISWKS